MVDRTVQDVFRCTTNCKLVVNQSDVGAVVTPAPPPSFPAQDVSAILVAQNKGSVSQMTGLGYSPVSWYRSDCLTTKG